MGSISTHRSPNRYRTLCKSSRNCARNPIVDLIVISDSKKTHNRRKIFFLSKDLSQEYHLKTGRMPLESLVGGGLKPRNIHRNHASAFPSLTLFAKLLYK